jgi:hypothetical protein
MRLRDKHTCMCCVPVLMYMHMCDVASLFVVHTLSLSLSLFLSLSLSLSLAQTYIYTYMHVCMYIQNTHNYTHANTRAEHLQQSCKLVPEHKSLASAQGPFPEGGGVPGLPAYSGSPQTIMHASAADMHRYCAFVLRQPTSTYSV